MNNTSKFYNRLNAIQCKIGNGEVSIHNLFVWMCELIDESEQQTIAIQSQLSELRMQCISDAGQLQDSYNPNADEALGKQLDVYVTDFVKPKDYNLIQISKIRADVEVIIEPYREAHAEQMAVENAKLGSGHE